MLYLILCIVCTSYLVFAFKVFDKYGVNHFHAIVINYIVCVITGCIVNQYLPTYTQYADRSWFWIAALLGCSFITLFNLMSVVTLRQGVTVTNVATKLSMVIPITVAIFFYDEPFTILKGVGILFALVAVYLASQHPDPNHPSLKGLHLLLPLILFVGSGMNDSLVKHAQHSHLQSHEFNDFNIVIFSVAAGFGLLAMLYDVFILRHKFYPRALVAGIVLGVPNYFSLYFLIKALELPQLGASVIFPINNIGIVGFSAIVAWLFFHEKLSLKNWIGLGLAVVAILLMSFGG